LRETQKALTRETLIEAAYAAFEQKGYVETTVEDIIRRAGASRPTFYAHFEGKADVLEGVVRKLQQRDEYVRMQQRLRTLAAPTVELLQAWFDEYVTFYKNHLRIHEAIHQAMVLDRAFAAAQLRTLQGFIDLWGSVGFVRDTRSRSLRLAALMLFALGDQFMYMWLVQGVTIERDKATRALAEALLATLRKADSRG
jgi:AcrR family transcriptional regulator